MLRPVRAMRLRGCCRGLRLRESLLRRRLGSEHRSRHARDLDERVTAATADTGGAHEGVDEAWEATQRRRRSRLLESLGVLLALVAQRVECGGDDARRGESREVLG